MAGEGPLNDATIRALPIPERGNKEHVYKVHWFAGAMAQGVKAPAGFGVRVGSGGAKVFVLNYRLHGREYRYTIGQYPTWTATQAVREARELRQRIDRGDNPLDAKHTAQSAPTVTELADLYLDEGPAEKPNKKASSWQTDRSNIERHIKPLLG